MRRNLYSEKLKLLLKGYLFAFLLTFGLSSHAIASQAEKELQDLLLFYDQSELYVTKIATKTEINSDLAPGIVTILKGENLKVRGIRTVLEALQLVPGVYIYKNSLGERLVSVRGVGGDLYSGNLKIMLDDVNLNESLSAAGYAIYEIPIEQVDRIEIIRGPGSVVYGEYAYAGAINVKMLKKGNRLFARLEGEDDSMPYSYGGGGTFTFAKPEDDLLVNLNLSGWNSDGPEIQAGKDRLYAGIFGYDFGDFSYAPGPTNEAEKDRFANLCLKYKSFSLKGQYLSVGNGDYFGMVQILPPPEDRADHFHNYQVLEATKDHKLSGDFKLSLKTGWRRYELDMDDPKVLPFIALEDNSILQTPTIASVYYEENEIYGGTELISKTIKDHSILLGAKYSHIEMGDTWVDSNSNTDLIKTGVRMSRLTGERNWIREHVKRDIFSLYLQDLFDITDHFTMTAGLRYDHYDNHDLQAGKYDHATARLSAVYRLSDRHIFKAQFSEGVRPPTFSEMYAQANTLMRGNPRLDPERIRSWELGYIYRHLYTVGRFTLFLSDLKKKIDYPDYADPLSLGQGDIAYRNIDEKIQTKGFELELAHEITTQLYINSNLSYAHTKDENNDPIAGAADWLANIGLIYHPIEDYSLSLQHQHVGKRHRAIQDPRDDLEAYNRVDLAVNILNLWSKGISVNAGVKNLFDVSIHYPAPVFKDYQGAIDYTYPDDFPRQGRELWIQISYKIL